MHECEARHVLNLPQLVQRQAYLDGRVNKWGRMEGGILQRRGAEACARLKETILQLHRQRAAEAKARVLARTEPQNEPGERTNENRKAA
jgi:hypothetical protein